jgi:hypothetical protein
LSAKEIILFPVGFVVIPVNPVSIDPEKPPVVVTAFEEIQNHLL